MEFKNAVKSLNVDYEQALGHFADNEDLYQKFVIKFVKNKSYSALEQSFLKKDFEQMLIQTHSLKGLSATLGFNELSQYCREMEISLKQNKATDLERQFEKIKLEYESIIHIIEKVIS